jgi:hypothetical protein
MFRVFFVFLLSISSARAGDVMPAGTVLESESYVFTIEEATALLSRVEELEVKEMELERYIALDEIRTQQIDLYKINIDSTREQLSYHIELAVTHQELINHYNRRNRFNTWENAGFFVLGMGMSYGSFMIADSIAN